MVEKWILLRNRWRHEAFVLVQPNPVVAMKQHVTNGKGDRFIYWDHCPLLAVLCRSPFWHDWSSRMQTVVSTNAIGWSCAMQLRS